MPVQAFDKICNYYGISKVTYLASATFFTAGLIIECILLYLVVIPYLSEQKYVNTTCTYIEATRIGTLILKKCENKCSKETSQFHCLVVQIAYVRSNAYEWTYGYLFDNFRTFSKHKVDKVRWYDTTTPSIKYRIIHCEIWFVWWIFKLHGRCKQILWPKKLTLKP